MEAAGLVRQLFIELAGVCGSGTAPRTPESQAAELIDLVAPVELARVVLGPVRDIVADEHERLLWSV